MADPRPIPLAVTLGESVFDLGKRAPGLVRPDATVDSGAVMVTRLVELTVIADDEPLPLPPTRFAAIEQVAGRIVGMRTAPMANYARLKPSDGLARWLIGHARGAGWSLADGAPVELDALQAQLEAPDRLPVRRTYGTLRRGDATLRIVLEESATPAQAMKPRAPEPLFLVRTEFANKPLREAQLAKLFARRKELTGGTRSVPLSAWAR